ncbi:unnamed protein product [Cladocopium goreaui]|uniref:Uncharacterized protein n=1 Tax=Cladocopium goreaui TaxID=2562237 RepID=A0A9P1FZ27_9DINO|nr:unnamed protein product [Cladocopium goreaui]
MATNASSSQANSSNGKQSAHSTKDNSATSSCGAGSANATKRSRFGDPEDPLDAFMAGLEDQVKDDMSSIGKKKPEVLPKEKTEPAVDKHKAGAMKGAIQHQLKQRYKAKLNQMRGPRSD